MVATVTRDQLPNLRRAIRALTGTEVLIGIPSENSERRPEPGEIAPTNNAMIGYINEFGDPDLNIPPRPHLIPAVDRQREAVTERMRKAGEAALLGKSDDVDKIFNIVGLMVQREVQSLIRARIAPPLSPRTLADRRRRGRTGTVPLIDTGQYMAAITYVLHRRGQNQNQNPGSAPNATP